MLRAFVIVDESGFVTVKPVLEHTEPVARSPAVPVDIDLDSFLSATVYESATGVADLPAEVRAYIDAERQHLAGLRGDARIRLTEVLLREGDVVSAFGAVEEHVVDTGVYRQDGGERVLVLAGFPRALSVIPASLEECYWLVTFHRRVIAGLVIGAICGLGAAGTVIYQLVR
ncbi:MAG: hypothetical protein QM820_28930 [Minicystis sp.]